MSLISQARALWNVIGAEKTKNANTGARVNEAAQSILDAVADKANQTDELTTDPSLQEPDERPADVYLAAYAGLAHNSLQAESARQNGALDLFLKTLVVKDGDNRLVSPQEIELWNNINFAGIQSRNYTLDFTTQATLIQDLNIAGSITIEKIVAVNVETLYVTYPGMVKQPVDLTQAVSIIIANNTNIIWEINRITADALACVGVQYKFNI